MIKVMVDGSPLADGRRDAGIGRYVRDLYDALEEQPGIAATLVKPWRPPHESLAARFLSAQPTLLAGAATLRPDVVHATDAAPVLGFPRARQVVTVHDVIPWTRGRTGVTGAYLRGQAHSIRLCARVIAVSDSVAADITRVLRVDPDHVRLVPQAHGAAFTDVSDPGDVGARAAAGIPPGRYVLWVGSLRAHDPRKALDTLVEAMAEPGLPATLVLVGAPGVESARMSALAAAQGVTLALPGFVDDAALAALYRHAGAVVVPSLHEGFGLPVLEALACAAPVVATAVGNIPDLAGEAAALVPPGDAAELAGALRRMLTDRGYRQELSSRGPAIAANYSWRRTAELTAAVYREVA
ncbi:MAG TPA: glycosyltransferase family 1 protein [Candidatus Dormibacteraeota bacterium]|nr:glycosyltransferase family 1 protein [Candidatus Dormibacteraeota bacterium]